MSLVIIIFVYGALFSVAGWGFYIKLVAVEVAELLFKLPRLVVTQVEMGATEARLFQGLYLAFERQVQSSRLSESAKIAFMEDMYIQVESQFFIFRLLSSPLFHLLAITAWVVIVLFIIIPCVGAWLTRRHPAIRTVPFFTSERKSK
jgi:hypothetical protein